MTQPNVDFRSELAGQAAALRSLATRLVSRHDAEDLTHDAMVTALSQRTLPRRVRPWLRQVLRNEAKARRRSTLRREAREQRAVLHQDALGLEALAENAQMANAVRDALVALDPAYRRVLEARFYDERTAADIARSEGCPAGTVRWRVQEGLRRMRSSLDARFDGRDAWRERMAAFAAAPLTLVGPPQGEAHMISSPLFSKLALGAVTTLAAAGILVTATAHEAPERASEQPAARPHMAAVTTSPVPTRRSVAASVVDAAQPVAPAPEQEPDAPECETCAAGMPSFDAMAECVERFPVSASGRIDANVRLEGTVVDRVTVTSKSDADADLAECLRDSMPGSEANVGADGLQTDEINLVVFPDVAEVPTDVDAPTPLEMADEGLLPTRTEGRDPVRTIVACSDYECPFCERARATLDQVLDEYPDVQVAWMHDPLPVHEGAAVAARAATAAQAQGKFWEMHELLFEHPNAHSEDDVLGHARTLDLDMARFAEDFAAADEAIESQRKSCDAAGAKGTPSFFIGDTVFIGAQPIEAFRDALD